MGTHAHIRTPASETQPCASARGGWRACALAVMAVLALVLGPLAGPARAAEKKQRQQALMQRAREIPLTPVRVAHQPTFSRYIFQLPELIAVTNERAKDKLTLVFDKMMKFDLASAKSPLPPMVASIDA